LKYGAGQRRIIASRENERLAAKAIWSFSTAKPLVRMIMVQQQMKGDFP